MSFDEQRKAELDQKMARADRERVSDETPGEPDGLVDEAKDKLQSVVDRAKDVLHHDHAGRGDV